MHMGKGELESWKRKKNADLTKLILGTVAAAGVVSVSLLAPNVIAAISRMGLLPKNRQSDIIKNSRERLIKNGMLEYSGGNLSITKKGEVALQLANANKNSSNNKPKRWDGRWRVLMFDIPEKRKGTRDRVRRNLGDIGFIRLQDSVWLYPYDCEDFITLLKSELRIGKNMIYLIVDFLEYDKPYLKHFGLKKK